MRRPGFPISGLTILVAGVVWGMGNTDVNVGSLTQSQTAITSPLSPPAIGTHGTSGEWRTVLKPGEVSEIPEQISASEIPLPTRSSFMAHWDNKDGAVGYLLDVSTNSSFLSYVEGYHDLDVGHVAARVVTGLKPGTTYYFRVRAYGATGLDRYSEAMTATTVATSGLSIQATFDSSITSNPNAVAIEATINRAISIYESLFRDPITVQILFRYATTLPNGDPVPGGFIARSNFVYYTIPWSTAVNALRADARTGNDSLAIASLPGTPLSPNIKASSANGRAVGENTPTAMFANGTVGVGGPYDGIVTLNSSAPFQFTRPASMGSYDAERAIQHEMDEVLGFGSYLSLNPRGADLRPQDLFSWSSAGVRNTSTSGMRYFSLTSGVSRIVNFNQNPSGDFGDWLSATCPQAQPYVQNAFGCTGQSSDVTSTSPEGINLDVIGYDLTPSNASVLGNISTRSFVQTGAQVMIGGFIIEGTASKTVIVRAIGPDLTRFGVPNALVDPTLELHNRGGGLIASNDNWQNTVIGGIITGNQANRIQDSGHAPNQPSESAIIATLQPGNYTAIVRGVNNTAGVALVEVYDLSANSASSLGNISTRSFVQTNDSVMIGGFIVQGSGPKRVIVRAVGPELRRFGVPNALADPILDLHNNSGNLIASNNNWQTTVIGGAITSDQVAEIRNSGHAPTEASESAIIATLQPGKYTAIVRGVNNTTGIALVDVYDLDH